MGVYTYNEAVVYTPETNDTWAAKRVYKINECKDTLIANNAADLWCNNLCGQDEPYCNPFVKGDKIYFQYFSDNTSFWKVLPKIYNGETDELIESNPYITTQSGTDANGSAYLNIVIDTTNLPISCFYMRVILFNCDVDPVVYQDCVNTQLANGATPEDAEYNCSITLCGPGVSEIITEPYCEKPCGSTVLIEGVYPAKDCDGNYYGDLTTGAPPVIAANIYKAQIRVPGEVIKQAFGFTTTVVNNTKQKSKQTDSYQLLTPLIPPYVAEKIALCFNAKQLFIDGIEYDSGAEIAKNNDEGQMWIINTQITKSCEQISFNCE